MDPDIEDDHPEGRLPRGQEGDCDCGYRPQDRTIEGDELEEEDDQTEDEGSGDHEEEERHRRHRHDNEHVDQRTEAPEPELMTSTKEGGGESLPALGRDETHEAADIEVWIDTEIDPSDQDEDRADHHTRCSL